MRKTFVLCEKKTKSNLQNKAKVSVPPLIAYDAPDSRKKTGERWKKEYSISSILLYIIAYST